MVTLGLGFALGNRGGPGTTTTSRSLNTSGTFTRVLNTSGTFTRVLNTSGTFTRVLIHLVHLHVF